MCVVTAQNVPRRQRRGDFVKSFVQNPKALIRLRWSQLGVHWHKQSHVSFASSRSGLSRGGRGAAREAPQVAGKQQQPRKISAGYATAAPPSTTHTAAHKCHPSPSRMPSPHFGRCRSAASGDWGTVDWALRGPDRVGERVPICAPWPDSTRSTAKQSAARVADLRALLRKLEEAQGEEDRTKIVSENAKELALLVSHSSPALAVQPA